ncbi:MAG TPA: STAS domain-containing protein [Roseiflexaceae bacterium]|nr:STAS domain-containing protein [Roseiflexaceae bacterium]
MSIWRFATFRYLCYGALFGACFPVTATLFDMWLRDLPFSFASAAFVQSSQPLHLMIDTAPLFLGLFAALAGRRQDRLLEMLHRAERAEENARLNAENARLYEQTSRQLEELRQLQANLEGAARTIRTLSVPLISVGSAILALPLLGSFDGQRMAELRTATVAGVHAQRARVLIVDCTGVDDMADEAVHELIQTVDALKLLGTRTIVCGIGVALARRLSDHVLREQSFETTLDMASGIARAQTYVSEG